jgi:hypothetical protein
LPSAYGDTAVKPEKPKYGLKKEAVLKQLIAAHFPNFW